MQARTLTAQQFRTWRERAHYTRPEAAAVFGVHEQTIYGWEHALWRIPGRVATYLAPEGIGPAPRVIRPPPIRHDPACPPVSNCTSCRMRRARASRRTYSHTPRWNDWTMEQDAWLLARAGEETTSDLAVACSLRFKIPRTSAAVRSRLRRLGESAQIGHYTATGIARLLGVAPVVVRRWLARGLLTDGTQHRVGGGLYSISAAALEAFIRTQRHRYDWRRVRPGRWRNLAELLWQRDPLYSAAEAAVRLGLSVTQVRARCARGSLPGAQLGANWSTRGWRIPRSAIIAYERGMDSH